MVKRDKKCTRSENVSESMRVTYIQIIYRQTDRATLGPKKDESSDLVGIAQRPAGDCVA